MKVVNIHEAKTHFSKLINEVVSGKSVIIAKAGVPIVKLTVYEEELQPREGGQLAGILNIPDDFDAPLPKDIANQFTEDEEK